MRRYSAALLLLASVAAAEPTGDKEAAQTKNKEGVRLMDAGNYEGAITQFRDAYALYASPVLLMNIGSCYVKLGRPVEALDHYERFLREGCAGATSDKCDQANEQAEKLRDEVGEIRVQAPDGTSIAIDGRSVGEAPIAPVRVPVGPHAIRLAASDGRVETFDRDVTARSSVVVALRGKGSPPARVLPRASAREPAFVSEAAATERQPQPLYERWWFWSGVGAVVVGAVVTGVVLSSSSGESSSALPEADDVWDLREQR